MTDRESLRGILEIINRFKLFHVYTIRDYENAMGDIRELIPDGVEFS